MTLLKVVNRALADDVISPVLLRCEVAFE